MKSSIRQYLYSVFRQAAHEFNYFGKKFAQMLLRTPLPKVLVVCVALAILVMLIPLVLTLFVVFLLLKLFLLLVVLVVRKNRRDPSELTYVHRTYGKK
jgi:hypothetical protein